MCVHWIARRTGRRVRAFATWSFTKVILTVEAHLNAVDKQTKRLFTTGLGMTAALWLDAVAPNSVMQLARWLEASVHRLHAWMVSAARIGTNVALWFITCWYSGMDLDHLAALQAAA